MVRTGAVVDLQPIDRLEEKIRQLDSMIDTLRAERAKAVDEAARLTRELDTVRAALQALTEAAQTGTGNLLDLSIQAMRARATVGEISDALESAFGRHRADIQKVTGVYAAAYDSAEGWDKLKGEIAAFADLAGRRPRVMIAKLGQDGHDRGAKVVATAFADLGYDVDMGPLFQTPEECARQAIENDVHAVGISTLAELVSNDRPLIAQYNGKIYFPLFHNQPESEFGGDFKTPTEWADPVIREQFARPGNWAVFTLNRYDANALNYFSPRPCAGATEATAYA